MRLQYLFRSPGSDIELGDSQLHLPFKITPTQSHPFLILRDYFEAIKSFILGDARKAFERILEEVLGSPVSLNDVDMLLIRSEKHGAFHHVASIEFIMNKAAAKFALATFLSSNEHWFRNECANLEEIQLLTKPYQFTPRLYLKGRHEIARRGQAETLFFMVSQWLEGYHEWHLYRRSNEKGSNITVWDDDQGHRPVSRQEAREIFYEIGFILTYCYDFAEHRRVGRWSNAAGDFVVGSKAGSTEVMLTTVRDYAPVVDIESLKSNQPLMPLTFFFFETLTLARLDRHEGVGNLLWCEDWCIFPVIKGIFDALEEKASQGKLPPTMPSEFLLLLKSFTPEEIETLLQYTLTQLGNTNPQLPGYLTLRLAQHAQELYDTIQMFQI